MKSKNFSLLLPIGILLSGFALATGIMLGSRIISPNEIFCVITGNADDITSGIFLYSRLPRTLASFVSGAALAVSGAVLQSVLGNKLASPGIIGVNAGAGFGVTLCTTIGIISGVAVSLFSFAGSLLAVAVLSFFAAKTSASKTTVILGGVALNSILSAFSESLCVLDGDVAQLTTEFRVGGFSSISYSRLIPAGVMIVAALILLFTLFNELDVVALGDETSRSVGLKVKKYRIIFLVLSALLAGAAVSFSGLLGFVGLIVPHFMRKLSKDNESRHILPLCVLFGGAFVCLCDTLSRLLFIPYELPVGIIMSVIGGPLFVTMLVNMKKGHRK